MDGYPRAVALVQSVFGRTERRTWIVVAVAVYVVTYVAVYVRVISPNYVESGLVNDLPADGSIAMAAALATLPALWMPAVADRPSAVGLWILYITGYIPSVLIPGFLLGEGWGLIPYWLALGGSFLVVGLTPGVVKVALPRVSLGPLSYRWLLIAIAIVATLSAVMLFGLPTRLPGLEAVYDVRGEFDEALAETGRIGGYVVWWTGSAIAPMLVAYGVWMRRPLMVTGGFGLFILVYGLAAFRSIIFTAIAVVALLVAIRRAPRRFGIVAPIAILGVTALAVAIAAANWFTPLSLAVRRLLVVPGQVIAYYYDQFTHGSHYLLSHSVLSGVTTSPYDVTPPVLIGRLYYATPGIHANGNLWADGLANFGLPGLIVASFLLASLLVLMDAVARGKPVLVAATVGGFSLWSLTNSGLLTAVMTHGIAFTAALIWLLPNRRALPRLDRRVVHLTTVHRSDDPRILLKECASLALDGFEVLLVGRGAPPQHLPPNVSFVSIGDVRSRLARMVLLPARAMVRAWRLRAGLYHVHDPELLPVAVLLKLTGARVVYDAHEDLPRQVEYKEYLPRWLRAPLAAVLAVVEQIAIRLLDAVVAATPRIGQRFPRRRTTIVQNFPLSNEFAEREPSPYAERPRLVVYVGRLTDAAGARVMAQAADAMRSDGTRYVLGGPIDPVLERDLRIVAGSAPVEFPGRLSRTEVIALLDQARVGVVVFQPVANYVEAYPTKLFEYMASGVPVVASDFPLWREIVGSAACGLLVDPRDPRDVARAITRLLDDPELAQEMGQNGRRAVFRQYRWEDQAARLNGLYRRLLKVGRAVTPDGNTPL